MDSTTAKDLNVRLDILAQQPLLRIYTQLSFCFARPSTVSDAAIVQTLTQGLERLSASFPWVAGQVVNEGSSEADSGIFSIKPLERSPRLSVNDLREDPAAPTMGGLRQARFPMSMLDEDVVAPRRTLPGGSGCSPADPEPVFLVQVNFVRGGLILTANAQHSTMDMTGQAEVIKLLSKACHGEEFTPEEISAGNLPRDTVIPLLDNSYDPGREVENQVVRVPAPAEPELPPPPAVPPKVTWAYFTSSAQSLAALKQEALSSKAADSGFISTDDSFSALFWQACCRARLSRLDPSTETTFCRAVDVRHPMGVSRLYPGLLQNMTFNQRTLQQVVDEPLGAVAARLRAELDPAQLRHRTRALATVMSRTPDKSGISFVARVDPSKDLMLSSWAKVDCWKLDFNLGLGPPESVRRPRFTPYEGLAYLMPRSPDGEISAAISLRDEDLERLKRDEAFTRFCSYIG